MQASSSDRETQDTALREIYARAKQRGLSKEMLRRVIRVAGTKGGYPAIRASRRLRYQELYERAVKEHAMIHQLVCGEEREAVRCGTEAKACTAGDKNVRLHHRYCRALAESLAPKEWVFVLLPRKARDLNEIVGHLIDDIGLSIDDVALLRERLSRGAPSFVAPGVLAHARHAVKTAYSAHKKRLLKRGQKRAGPIVKIVKKKKTRPEPT